jgi:hypothetical protein
MTYKGKIELILLKKTAQIKIMERCDRGIEKMF